MKKTKKFRKKKKYLNNIISLNIRSIKNEEVSSKPSNDTNPENNGLVFGSALDQAIDSMVNMGFPRNDVIQALHAAYHNPDKALDYLFNVFQIDFICNQLFLQGNTRFIYDGTRIEY